MVGIYKITNKLNNKVYIGQSINVKRRWQEHKQCANPTNKSFKATKHLYKAIAKYGISNFKFCLLEECRVDQLDKLEISYIQLYNSANPAFGYNVQLGGNSSKTLTPAYVFEVIAELQLTNETITELAARLGIDRRTIYRINIGESWKQAELSYPIRTAKIVSVRARAKPGYKGKDFRTVEEKTQHKLETCYKPKYVWPSKQQLLGEIAKASFEAVGRKYGVSGNAIKKLCKRYGLPSHKKDIMELYNSITVDS